MYRPQNLIPHGLSHLNSLYGLSILILYIKSKSTNKLSEIDFKF